MPFPTDRALGNTDKVEKRPEKLLTSGLNDIMQFILLFITVR